MTSPSGDRLQLAVPGCGASPVAVADLEAAAVGRDRLEAVERRAEHEPSSG